MTTATRQQAAESTRPGRRRLDGLTAAIVVIGLIGLGIASYTTYEHYNGLKGLLCVGSHGGHSSCYTVQSSVYSEVGGVPVALLGVIGYVVLLASLAVRNELGRAFGFMVALIGFGFSAYLTYREVFTLQAICEWCVGSAICMTILMVLTGARFLRGDPPAFTSS